MKTSTCYPKVIIHRLGGPVETPRRFTAAGLLGLLLLAALAAGVVHAARDHRGPGQPVLLSDRGR